MLVSAAVETHFLWVCVQCNFIFRAQELDLGRLATAFALLKLPGMPELAHQRTLPNFTPSSVDPKTIKVNPCLILLFVMCWLTPEDLSLHLVLSGSCRGIVDRRFNYEDYVLQFKDKAREKERQKRIAARALMPKASTSTSCFRTSSAVECSAYVCYEAHSKA